MAPVSCYTAPMRLATLALVATLAACHRAPGPAAPANQAEPPAAELIAKDPLAFLPRDSELVIDLDVARLKQSPLWASQIEPQLRQILGATNLDALLDACGIDYLQATTRVTTGMKKTGDHYTGVIVVRGPDAATTMTCIERTTAKQLKVTRDHDALLVTVSAPTSMAIGAAGGNALVVLTDVGASRAMLADTIAAGTPLRSSPAFMALYDAVEPTASFVTIANGASPMFAPMQTFGVSPKWVIITATVASSYVVAGRVTMKDAAEAQRLASMIEGNVGALRAMIERLDVRAEEAVVHVDIAVTEDQAKRILGMMGGAL